jgi:hypothetical protein
MAMISSSFRKNQHRFYLPLLDAGMVAGTFENGGFGPP